MPERTTRNVRSGLSRLMLGALACVALAGCSVEAPDRPVAVTENSGAAPSVAAATDAPAPDTVATPAAQPQLFVRVDDVIDDAELASLGQLDSVTWVVASQRDDVAMIASARSDGTSVDSLPDDFKISLAGQADQGTLGLQPGEVALTTEALPLRNLDVGGTLTLVDGGARRIVAIVDAPVYEGVEVIIADSEADALGFRERQRAVLTLSSGVDPETVAAAVRSLLGEDTVTQLRSTDDRDYVLSLPQTKARFGEFAFKDLDGRDIQAGVSWIRASIVTAQVPIIGRVVCHTLIIDDLTAVMQDIADAGLASEIDPDLYGGCWSPRRINRNANLSRHAWGIAIDVNVDFDAPGMGPIPSPEVITAFERHGFRWGGDYPIPDNHHFEWVGP